MEKRYLPKVLVVDVNAWREDAASNTLMEIFRSWDRERLALVYTSSELPNTSACDRFFQIGENQILRSVYKPGMKVGRKVENTPSKNDADAQAERDLRTKAHRSGRKWMRLAREVVWKLGHWKTAALDQFVSEFEPDVLFIPIFAYAYMGRIEEHIIKMTGKPTVCYLADDNYSYDACRDVLDYVMRSWNRKYVRSLATGCKEMFVIVDKEKEDTDNRFGTDSVILTKSIDFTGKCFREKEIKMPLKFVYTGSLLIGRGETLSVVADAINKVNNDAGEMKAELYVYSQTAPANEVLNHINNGSAHFCGSVPHQKILGILQDADVVIFAEAMHGKEANIAKLSFSTKITDYLSTGKCILAIGKEDIAPIDYFRRNDAALIASCDEDILEQVCKILASPAIINQMGKAAFVCAVKNHEKGAVTERFINTMLRASEK